MLNIPALAALIVPFVTFDFLCPVSLTAQTLASLTSIIGPMTINNVNNFVCSPFNDGFQRASNMTMTTPIIQSINTIAAFKHDLEHSQGLTVETWITPMLSKSIASLPIVTIGRRGDKSYSARPRDRCHDYDFRLSQYATYIQLSYTAVGKCETILLATTELNATLTQVVVSFTDSSTSVHINGKTVSMPSVTHFLTPHIDNWNSTYGLQLFSDNVLPTYDVANAPDEVFGGAIHSLKFYDYALKGDDVSILFQAGLRNSKTVGGFEVTTTIVDDKNKTTTIVSQTGVAPSRLTASYSDILLVEGKLDKSSFTIGGYVYGVNLSTILLEIVSLPSQGKLSYNGVTLVAGDRIPTTFNYSASLRYGGLAEHFFNIANTTSDGVYLGLTPESFEYRLMEVNQSGGVLAMSENVRPTIQIVNVNDVPEDLVVPTEIFLTGEKSHRVGICTLSMEFIWMTARIATLTKFVWRLKWSVGLATCNSTVNTLSLPSLLVAVCDVIRIGNAVGMAKVVS